ncbi:hypothetical protein X798_01518 [Onchocerca flexuosa]|uniref:Uncharacterized protein n=1 Tax=Onchocerca flexuosa TaxID=387005 RepID=A0A238C3E0_9BILA|nr:hypothetical protein X798_01518 [Onchocerca flexuosa]
MYNFLYIKSKETFMMYYIFKANRTWLFAAIIIKSSVTVISITHNTVAMKGLLRHLCSSSLITALIITISVQYTMGQLQTCSQILASSTEENEKVWLCQLYESSSLLTQLGALVYKDVEKLLSNEGVITDEVQDIEKRKHEYLRFGKRKHEYLRFGKRKHEYLRFGRK